MGLPLPGRPAGERERSMTRLHLLRHGIAENAGPATGGRDEPRALTERGIAQMHAGARGIAALDLAIDTVLTSPLTRCLQTAAIVCEHIGGTPQQDQRLRPGLDLASLDDVLLEHPDAASVLVCGHEPDLSIMVAVLTGGAGLHFRKGSLAVLDVEARRPRGARLRAFYEPRLLRMIPGGDAPG